MNPFMTAFALLGLLYVPIVIWSLVMGFMGSLGISVAGLLVCVLGWIYAERHLQ
jgi:hypothetical protein